MKLLITTLTFLAVATVANAKLPTHEVQMNSTQAVISNNSGGTSTVISADYAYALNRNIQLNGTLALYSGGGSSTAIGVGAKYNFQPLRFMNSYYAKGLITLVSGESIITLGGGKRFKLTRHVAYTPEAYLSISDGNTAVVLYPVAFSFSTNKIGFR